MDEMDVSDAPMGDHEDKKFLKSLECPICKDILKEPKMLKCYHFFCKKCLYSTERARRDLGSTTTHDHEIDSFACGVCRQVTQLRDLANVPMVNHILEEYRRNKSQDTTCGWCEDRDSSYRCIECKMIYCEPCKTKHDGIRLFVIVRVTLVSISTVTAYNSFSLQRKSTVKSIAMKSASLTANNARRWCVLFA